MVEEYGVRLEDFGRHADEELLVLNCNHNGVRWTDEGALRPHKERERVDYIDTQQTMALRDEVRRINQHLAQANIAFLDDGLEPRIDASRRTLKRYFVIGRGEAARFDKMGRLFGNAFWLNLSSRRRANIRIDGEEVAAADFSSMFLRLVYAAAQEAPPEGDLYAIPGLENVPRAFVKFAVNCFLCDRRKRNEWPHNEDGGGREIPEGLIPQFVRNAILKAHTILSGVLGTGAGLQLMHLESRIMVAVLLRLVDEHVTALPLHDGLLVARSKVETAKKAMEEVSDELVGVRLRVELKDNHLCV
jgi:hypothetical protein